MTVCLDHNASTPADPRVVEAMTPWLCTAGNPSSRHAPGRAARAALETAREQVAALVNAGPDEVTFTSGGTEANNLALAGVLALAGDGALAISAIEHSSVRVTARALAQDTGRALRELPVDGDGRVRRDALAGDDRPALVSVMHANNETGVIQDIAAFAEAAHARGALMHTDAVQSAGKIPVDFSALGADLLSLSAHKIYGPRGVGALVHRRGLALAPVLRGGGHERGLRAGTENLAGIVGFGVACELARNELDARRRHAETLRRRLEQALDGLPGIGVIARDAPRVGNTTAITVQGMQGETLLMLLDRAGFAVSSGSACSAGGAAASHVLTAMGMDPALAGTAIRISTGKDTDAAGIDAFVAALSRCLRGAGGMPAVAAAGRPA